MEAWGRDREEDVRRHGGGSVKVIVVVVEAVRRHGVEGREEAVRRHGEVSGGMGSRP